MNASTATHAGISPIRRVFIVVLDSAGVGFMPDAGGYGEQGGDLGVEVGEGGAGLLAGGALLVAGGPGGAASDGSFTYPLGQTARREFVRRRR